MTNLPSSDPLMQTIADGPNIYTPPDGCGMTFEEIREAISNGIDTLAPMVAITPHAAIQAPYGLPVEYPSQEDGKQLTGPENGDDEDNLPTSSITKVSRLSVNIDRLTVFGRLPFDNKEKVKDVSEAAPNTSLLSVTGYQSVKIGPYTLVRQLYSIGVCKYVYWVYHKNYSDPIGKVRCRPSGVDKRRFWFDPNNHVFYTDGGIDSINDFIKTLGVVNPKITYLEVSADSPELHSVIAKIQELGAKKMNGGHTAFDKHGARFGKRSSDRSATFYNTGKSLKQRGKVYIHDRAKEVLGDHPMRSLWRFEWRMNGNENKRLTYTDNNGDRQLITLDCLTDPAVVLAIFRTQTESGFIFRTPDPTTSKLTPLEFFDWEAIGAKKLGRTERHLRSDGVTHCRKQGINALLLDARKGDYLVKTLNHKLTKSFTERLTDRAGLDGLKDALLSDPCALTDSHVDDILRTFLTDVAQRLAAETAEALPHMIAGVMRNEFSLHDYHRRKKFLADQLPDVDRPLSTLKMVA